MIPGALAVTGSGASQVSGPRAVTVSAVSSTLRLNTSGAGGGRRAAGFAYCRLDGRGGELGQAPFELSLGLQEFGGARAE